MGQYTRKGLYNSYKKNNKERAEKDYYATPTAEVYNILDTLNYNFDNKTILDPCVGGGHMMEGIINYCTTKGANNFKLIGTDIQYRGYVSDQVRTEYGLDFLADDYPHDSIDIVVMNPPYSTLEPFIIRGLEVAKDKLIVLCRTQVLEGVGRYVNIFQQNPPTKVYQYINRISCWRNGIQLPTASSAQAYCWLVWDKAANTQTPQLFWLWRKDK